MSRLSERLNCKVMIEAPAELWLDIWFSPSIAPSWRSRGAVTEAVITSGLAPG